MDTARKTLKAEYSCKYCEYYKQSINNNGKKSCHGVCILTGSYKKRTDKCKKYIKKNLIGRLI